MSILFLLASLATSPELHAARDCAAVFGDEETVAENETVREERLNFIVDSGAHVVVDHSYSWSEPESAEIRSFELVDTSTGGALAVFGAGDEGFDCADGVYLLSADDSLGPDGRIIAVLQQALLIELEDELFFIVPEGDDPPDFVVAWSSRFGVPRPRTVSPARPVRQRRR